MASEEELDRLVRQLRQSSWLDPATATGSLPKVPTTSLGTLPTASADYRGRVIMVYGAAGVADAFYVCKKDAADAYSWVALPNTDLSAIDFLVGTASGLLSAEIAVGTTPGGELGGTWPAPTVDATHSGSIHMALAGELTGTRSTPTITASHSGSTHASVAGAERLRASNTGEVTTNNTAAQDLLTLSGFSIPATNGLIIRGVARKTSGAAAAAGLGYSLNSTVISEASVAGNRLWLSTAANQAESGVFELEIMPRSTNYLNGYIPTSGVAVPTGALTFTAQNSINGIATATYDTAAITQVVIRAITGNALVTVAVKEVAVYEVYYQ